MKHVSKAVDKTMDKGNSPFVVLVTMAMFIPLAAYSFQTIQFSDENVGYSRKEVKQLNELIHYTTTHKMSKLEKQLRRAAALKDIYGLNDADIIHPNDIYR